MKKIKAFTLVEMVVCIVITCIVVFFVYTMMFSSYKTFFKLDSISRQRNDIRYFEKLFRNSVINAEYISITNNSISCGYYDLSGMFSEGYRLDVYSFSNTVTLSNNSAKSLSLAGENLASYGSNKCNIYLTIKRADSNYAPQSDLRAQEIVLQDVNKMFYNTTAFTQQRHEYLTFSLIYSKTLKDGEINYESQTYIFNAKSKKFKA